MRRYLLIAVLLLTASAAAGQAPMAPPGDTTGQAPAAPQQPPADQAAPPEQMAPPATMPPAAGRPHPMRERFAAANTTGDGKLTLEQAQAAHMAGVVMHFHEIDADGKGYVTFEDWTHWLAARRNAAPTR
jgi:hypothetical protein